MGQGCMCVCLCPSLVSMMQVISLMRGMCFDCSARKSVENPRHKFSNKKQCVVDAVLHAVIASNLFDQVTKPTPYGDGVDLFGQNSHLSCGFKFYDMNAFP